MLFNNCYLWIVFGGLNTFTIIHAMTGGGPVRATEALVHKRSQKRFY